MLELHIIEYYTENIRLNYFSFSLLQKSTLYIIQLHLRQEIFSVNLKHLNFKLNFINCNFVAKLKIILLIKYLIT